MLTPRRSTPEHLSKGLAEIALELACRIDEIDFGQCCYALELEAMAAGKHRSNLEVTAARIGLSRDATAKVLDDYELRAKLMHAAAEVIRGLMLRPALSRGPETAEPSSKHAPEVLEGPLVYAPAHVRLAVGASTGA